MSILEHLEDLRSCLIYSLVFIFLGVCVGFLFARPVVYFLVQPLRSDVVKREEDFLKVIVDRETGIWRFENRAEGIFSEDLSPSRLGFYFSDSDLEGEPDYVFGPSFRKPIFLSPLDPLTLYFKSALIVGLIMALPFVLFQVWRFVAPGLLPPERRTALVMLGFGSVLFPTGALFAYMMFGMVLNFLLNFQIMNMEPQLEIFRFVNLELRMMLAFGVVFELPLVIMFLTLLGVVHPRQLRKYRPHVVTGLAVLAMMFTPPDPFSMLLMLAPLVILYELSIWLSLPFARKRAEAHD